MGWEDRAAALCLPLPRSQNIRKPGQHSCLSRAFFPGGTQAALLCLMSPAGVVSAGDSLLQPLGRPSFGSGDHAAPQTTPLTRRWDPAPSSGLAGGPGLGSAP